MEGSTTPPPATSSAGDPPPSPDDASPPATPPDPPPTMTPSNSPRPPSPSDERASEPLLSDPLGPSASPPEPQPPGSTCSSPGPTSLPDPLASESPDPEPPPQVLGSELEAPDSPSEPQPPESPSDPLAAVSTDPLAPESPAPPLSPSDPLASGSPSEPPPQTASDPLSSPVKRKKKGRGRPSGLAWFGKQGKPALIPKHGSNAPKKKIGRPFGSASKKKNSIQPSPTGKRRGKKKKRIGRPPKILPATSLNPPNPQNKTKRGASTDLPYQIIIPPYPPALPKKKPGATSDDLPYQIIIPPYPPALPQRTKSGPGLTTKSYEIIIPPNSPSPSPLQKKITIFKPPPKPLPTEICLICLRRYDKSDREPPLEEEVEVIEVVDKANPDPLLDEVVKANFRSAMAKESYPKANRLNVYLRFLKIISRYLQIKTRRFRTPAEKNKLLPPFCNECFHFTQNLCDVYNEWEVAKVALQWRLTQVTEAVKLSKSKVSGKLGTSLLKSLSTQLQMTNSKVVDNFRKQLSIKCSLKAKQLIQGPSISVDKDAVKKYSESKLKFPMQDMVGYLKSLIVVFALAVPHKEVIRPKKLESSSRKRKKSVKTAVKVKLEVIEGAEEPTDDHLAGGGVGSPPPSPDGPSSPIQNDEDEEDKQENEEEGEGLQGSDTDWSGNAGSDVEFSVGPSISRRWNLRKRRSRGKSDGDKNDDIDFSLQLPPLRSARPKAVVNEEDKKFPCNICNLRFYTDGTLKRHLSQKHEFILPYNCTHCPQRFKLRKFLDVHMKKAHPNLKTDQINALGIATTCNHCQKEFPSRAKMVLHRKKAHKASFAALFTCETCGKVVRGKFRFDLHLRSHSKETFSCTHPDCSRSFFKEGAFKAHLEFHQQNPGWTPSVVRKKSLPGINANASNCRGPYKCQVENCGRAFYKESHLTSHMTLHASSFTCSTCDKVFDSVPDIRSHLVSKHERKRKIFHHCMFCETAFTLKQTMEFHIKVNHPSQSTLVCDVGICPDEFETTDELREHLKSVHLSPDVVEIVEKVENGGIFCLGSKIDEKKTNTSPVDDKTEPASDTAVAVSTGAEADPTPNADDSATDPAPVNENDVKPDPYIGSDASASDSTSVSETAAAPVTVTDVADTPVPESTEDANAKPKQDEDILALGLFTCEKCRWSFSTRFGLSLHLITHAKRNDQGKFSCKLCTKNFRGMDSLQTHYNSEHGPNIKPIVCTVCGTRMQRKERYITHMRTHQEKEDIPNDDDTTPYLCSECGESCEGRVAYRKHMRAHGAAKMRTHKAKVPRPAGSSAVLQCDQCAETFPNNFRLLVHESNAHGKERPHTCGKEGCTRSFFTTSALKKHELSHETPTLQCSMCPKAFHQKHKLDVHIAVHHTDEKNHICHLCGKAFARPESLRIHMDVHSEVKNHKCSYCDKAFVRKQVLVCHERTHTKERPYPCRICGETFSQYSARKLHEDRHKRLNCNGKLPVRRRDQVSTSETEVKLRPGRKKRGKGKQQKRKRSRDNKAGAHVEKQEPNATPSSIIHEAFKAAFCDGTDMHGGDQVHGQNSSFSDPGLIKQDVLNSIEVLVNYDDTNAEEAQTPPEGTRRRGRAPKQKENQNQTPTTSSNSASDLTCGFCGKVFQRPKAYKAHVDRHLNEDSVLERGSSNATENNGSTSQQSHVTTNQQPRDMPTLEPLPTIAGFSTLTRRQARLLAAITPPPPQLEPEPPAKKRKGRPPGKGKKTTSEPPGIRLARIVEDVMHTATNAQYNNSRMGASQQNHHQQHSFQSHHQPVQSPSPHHNFYQSSPSPHQLMQSGSERSTPTMSPAPNQDHYQQQAQVTAATSTSTSAASAFLSPFLLPNPYLLQRQDPSQQQQHFFNQQGANITQQQQQQPPTSLPPNYAQYQYLLQNQGTGSNAGAQDLSKNSYPTFFPNLR